MGVKFLQTFVERYCFNNVCKSISIERLARNHNLQNDCESILLIDGLSLTHHLYIQKGLDSICGGQWSEFEKILEDFVSRFHEINVKLVCFFDAAVCSSKMNEWIRRRKLKLKEIEKLFSSIRSGTPKDVLNSKFKIPDGTGTFAAFTLKSLGVEVHLSVKEADEEMITFACRKEVFAIISQDSDFMIYDTKPYLSLNDLKIETLETKQYDRNALANILQIQINQLPLFACLTGTHFIASEKLRSYHKTICKKFEHISNLFPCIALSIKRNHWKGNIDDSGELEQISRVVFGHLDNLKLLKEGLESYATKRNPPALTCPEGVKASSNVLKAVYEKHQNCSSSCHPLSILYSLQYVSSVVTEDEKIFPSALVYKEIRQRCYSILFNSFTSSKYRNKSISVKEWCSYHGNELEGPELVSPLPLKLKNISSKGNLLLQ